MTAIENFPFIVGELYAFGRKIDDESSVWGIFHSQNEDGSICLEVVSADFNHFSTHFTLPHKYCRVREATRSELCDFYYNMGYCRV